MDWIIPRTPKFRILTEARIPRAFSYFFLVVFVFSPHASRHTHTTHSLCRIVLWLP